jgi:hypothetical protein
MALDGGLIVGYLTAAFLRAGGRLADRAVDSLLNRLVELVGSRMGRGPLDRLAGNPRDEATQREVGLIIDGAISVDRAFSRELAQLVAELDKRGGRQLVNNVYAQMTCRRSTTALRSAGISTTSTHRTPLTIRTPPSGLSSASS